MRHYSAVDVALAGAVRISEPSSTIRASFFLKKRIMTGLTFSGSYVSMSILTEQMNRPALRRQDLAPYPLGTVGNLHFTAREGGTPRAYYAAVLLSDACQSLSDKWADMQCCAFMESEDARARRESLREIRVYSQCMGELLGSLTAKVDRNTERFTDSLSQPRIGSALLELIRQPGGNLDDSVRKRNCLETYLDELKVVDLIALHNGVLACNHARAAVLRQVPSELFAQASDELNRIGVAVKQKFTLKVVQEPLEQLLKLLNCSPMDQFGARKQLLVLNKIVSQYAGEEAAETARDSYSLTSYVQHLPSEQLRTLMGPVSRSQASWFLRPHPVLLITILDMRYCRREIEIAAAMIRSLARAISSVLEQRGEARLAD